MKKLIVDILKKPVSAGIAAGLYPVLFYFSNNYSLVNSWDHAKHFIKLFLVYPTVAFVAIYLVAKWSVFKGIRKYVLPFLNLALFFSLIKVCLYAGFYWPIGVVFAIIAAAAAYFGYQHFKKLVLFQYLLAAIGLITLVPVVIQQMNISKEWSKQPDSITEAVFKKTPNVYFIQPDGYPNFSELKKGYYQLDPAQTEDYLTGLGFVNYDGFRSNYMSTLTSNSATFNMKHHYYNKGFGGKELPNARDQIISNNPILTIFKNNKYHTNFISEVPYFLMSRPKIGFDYCNYSYDNVDYFGTGLDKKIDVMLPLAERLEAMDSVPQFFFLQMISPGHIATYQKENDGIAKEKIKWVNKWEKANIRLQNVISLIAEKDPEALVIIMADHGGYVGFNYMREIYHKTDDRDLIFSAFSSQLSIRWPEEAPQYPKLKTGVNLFRHVFSYLTENPSYLEYLQENASYTIINKNAKKGIYKYIDDSDTIVFEKRD